MGRTILHCDMNNFYASVECMLDPSLRGHPVAVCGSAEERHGIVLAKNYQAKAYGVTTGEAVWQAKRKCPGLVTVPPHYERYMKYSRLAKALYGRYTDQVEPYGMDECFLDVTGSGCMGTGMEIAEQLRGLVKSELGLTISVGVSFNKVFAKLGSDMKKPDAVTRIAEDSFREQIWPLPASDLLGVGRATKKVLDSYAIRTIGQLAAAPESLLKARLGKFGLDLKRYAGGLDDSPVARSDDISPAKSVGHGITTLQDLENDAEVWQVMLELTQEIGLRLHAHGKRAGGIAIHIRDSRLLTRQWQCILATPTRSPLFLAREAFALFRRSYPWQSPIRSVTVQAIRLESDAEPVQLNLFTDTERLERWEKLDQTVEKIRHRYGMGAIRSAVLLGDCKLPGVLETELIMPTGML